MAKLIMTMGLPASGKTSWAQEQVSAHPNEVVRVNKDDLREMLHNGEHSKDREGFVINIRDSIIYAALSEGKTVIVDDTNFAPKHGARLRKISKEFGVEFVVEDSFLEVSPDECVRRDLKRGEKVGRQVIMSMYHKYVTPRLRAQHESKSRDMLPPAIIVDIDGTIALNTGRSPFDYSKVTEDDINPVVVSVLSSYVVDHEGTHVFFFSGRENVVVDREDGQATTYELTEEWLQEKILPHLFPSTQTSQTYSLHLRLEGDHRKDSIVKREMYDRHVKGKYDVRFVLDDRESVILMWRELGLLVLDVSGNSF